jgi:predicted outer membrane repeat protein
MTNNMVSGSSGNSAAPIQMRAAQSSSVSLTGNTFTDNLGSTHGVIEFEGNDQSVLEIRTSTFTNNRGQNGAGVVSLKLSSLSSALLSDNTFLNNTGTQIGAILISNGNTTMIRNVFQTNSAVNGFGGAIYGTGCGLSVTDSKFLFNSAKTGGAVYMSNTASPSSIYKCEFLHNTASEVGGAMYFSQNEQGVVIENSSFRSNSAAKQGGALHLNLNNQVNIVRNNSFESNWSQSFGGAMHCTSFGETPTLAILENEFTDNVAGGAANTTTFGAAYYTTTCRCANDTTGLSTFTNSSQIIAIEEGEVDPSCPIVSSSPPAAEPVTEPVTEPTLEPTPEPLTTPAYEPANEPLDAPVVEQPTEEPEGPEEPPIALGIVDPLPGGVELGVGAIVGIVVGIILLLLLLLLLIMLLLFYRRRRRSAQTKNGVDAGASPTTTTTAVPMSAAVLLGTEESASSESTGESNTSLPDIGEDDVAPLAVAMAPVPVVASAAVQKRIREVCLFLRRADSFPSSLTYFVVYCCCIEF